MIRNSTGNNVDTVLNFIPSLDPDVLIDGYRWLVKDLYRPREYYARVLTFLREYRPSGLRSHMYVSDFRAFMRSLWLLGVLVPGRWQFWKFLCLTWIKHRHAFGEAIDLAIRGYHFRMVAKGL